MAYPDRAYADRSYTDRAYSTSYTSTSGADRDIGIAVRDIFRRYDNGSGRMGYRDLRDCLRELRVDLNSREAESVLLQYDRDGNGFLELEEFGRIVKQAGYRGSEDRVIRGNISPEIRAVFEKYDHNRSGKLDFSELHTALKGMGLDASSNQSAEIIKRFDTDGNGLMELDEFSNLVWKLRESLYPQQVPGLRIALYILNTPGRVSASERRGHFGAPSQYPTGHRSGGVGAEYEQAAGSARQYISQQQIEAVLSSAISQTVQERASDGKARIAELLTGARKAGDLGIGTRSISERLEDAERENARLKAELKDRERADRDDPFRAMQQLADAVAREEGKADLRRMFNAIDTNRNGRISREEWARGVLRDGPAMAKYFGGTTYEGLIRAFDRIDANRSGYININELLDAGTRYRTGAGRASPPVSSQTTDREVTRLKEEHRVEIARIQRELDTAKSDLRRAEGERRDLTRLRDDLSRLKAYENMINRAIKPAVRDSFMSCDKDGSGDIDYKELKKALKGTGVRGDAAPDVMKKHDKDGKGSLNIMEFNNMVQEMLDAQKLYGPR